MNSAKALTPQDVDQLASKLYTKYCEAVGGKAFNGDPLPDWDTFRADLTKIKQSSAWIEVAVEAATQLA